MCIQQLTQAQEAVRRLPEFRERVGVAWQCGTKHGLLLGKVPTLGPDEWEKLIMDVENVGSQGQFPILLLTLSHLKASMV